jgi:hypothetical protein
LAQEKRASESASLLGLRSYSGGAGKENARKPGPVQMSMGWPKKNTSPPERGLEVDNPRKPGPVRRKKKYFAA